MSRHCSTNDPTNQTLTPKLTTYVHQKNKQILVQQVHSIIFQDMLFDPLPNSHQLFYSKKTCNPHPKCAEFNNDSYKNYIKKKLEPITHSEIKTKRVKLSRRKRNVSTKEGKGGKEHANLWTNNSVDKYNQTANRLLVSIPLN